MTVQTQQPQKVYVANAGDIIIYLLTAVAMLALGTLGWLTGAYFTMLALSALLAPWNVALPAAGLARWAIPLAISIVEVALFKFRERLPKWVLAIGAIVTVLDFASSIFGVVIAIGGVEIKLFTGFRIPALQENQAIPVLIGTIVSALLTVGPEQVLLSALGMFREVATGLWRAWRLS